MVSRPYVRRGTAAGSLRLAGMPRYFFNIVPGLPIDQEGEELPDDAAAIEIARQTAREIGPPAIPHERVIVSNEKGDVVGEVYLEDVS
jgi:hypothetical protein